MPAMIPIAAAIIGLTNHDTSQPRGLQSAIPSAPSHAVMSARPKRGAGSPVSATAVCIRNPCRTSRKQKATAAAISDRDMGPPRRRSRGIGATQEIIVAPSPDVQHELSRETNQARSEAALSRARREMGSIPTTQLQGTSRASHTPFGLRKSATSASRRREGSMTSSSAMLARLPTRACALPARCTWVRFIGRRPPERAMSGTVATRVA